MSLAVILVLILAAVAAASPATLAAANLLASVVVLVSPILLRYVRLDGVQMAAASYAAALLVAVLAGFLGGEFRQLDTSSAAGVLATSGWLWALQQAVYAVFRSRLQTPPAVPR